MFVAIIICFAISFLFLVFSLFLVVKLFSCYEKREENTQVRSPIYGLAKQRQNTFIVKKTANELAKREIISISNIFYEERVK